MSTTTPIGVFLVAALSACSVHQTDPCAGVTTSCLSVRVTGSGKVDTLDVTASGAFSETRTSTFPALESLPVRIAVVPQDGATGTLVLTVTGHDGTSIVGSGSSAGITLTGKDDHAEVEVALGALSPFDGGTVDQASGGDLSIPPGDVCAPNAALSCAGDGQTLTYCKADGSGTATRTCPISCSTASGAHCTVFQPHTPATAAMIAGAATGGDPVFTGNITINTDTGAISGLTNASTVDMGPETQAGITFQVLSPTSSVFTAHSFTFDVGSTAVVIGSRPLVLVAATTISVKGIIDGRVHDASSTLCAMGIASGGGFAGGTASTTGKKGLGGGGGNIGNMASVSEASGGGGGGGFASLGGTGGSGRNGSNLTTGGAGGIEVIGVFPIVGGSGGGAGSGGNAVGGSGGGAVQLVAGQSVIIGDGALSSIAGINVSGCGGNTGFFGSSPSGGGAGGSVVVEAPIMSLATYGAIAANGGGGAGGDLPVPIASDLTYGTPGGGATDSSGGEASLGGSGGGGSTAGGGAGVQASTNLSGGGGGGAAGRIQLFNTTGTIAIGTNGFLSPGQNALDTNSVPAASISMITLN